MVNCCALGQYCNKDGASKARAFAECKNNKGAAAASLQAFLPSSSSYSLSHICESVCLSLCTDRRSMAQDKDNAGRLRMGRRIVIEQVKEEREKSMEGGCKVSKGCVCALFSLFSPSSGC